MRREKGKMFSLIYIRKSRLRRIQIIIQKKTIQIQKFGWFYRPKGYGRCGLLLLRSSRRSLFVILFFSRCGFCRLRLFALLFLWHNNIYLRFNTIKVKRVFVKLFTRWRKFNTSVLRQKFSAFHDTITTC